MKLKFLRNSAAYLILMSACLWIAGCENIALVGRPSIADQDELLAGELTGEVEQLDTGSREIRLRMDGGRTRAVHYDAGTRVIYRGREYAVGDLEVGDRVTLQVKEDSRGRPYADLIRVQESARDRGRGGAAGSDRSDRLSETRLDGGMQTLSGTVERVDEERSLFDLREPSGERIIVFLPYNARRADLDQLQRLRTGDRVRVEGRFLSRDRFELEAFL